MLTQEQQTAFQARLNEERDRLQVLIHDLGAEVEQLANYEETEHATLGNHMADGGTEAFEQEQMLTLERNERDILARVEHALARLEAGGYGECEHCGQAIPLERLEILPYATLCVACQAELERTSPHRP